MTTHPRPSPTGGTMAMLRSRRLEALFGGDLDQVRAADIDALVTGQVAEAFDLDLKAELYGGSDKEKRDLASDVAAMANTAGGVIVLGVSEDNQARAEAALGVHVSDAEIARIRQIVAASVSPMPQFDVFAVRDEPPSERGFILIAVPRSVLAPHAVLVNESLRFPTRNGATTRHLAEPEVAAAYRARLASQADQAGRLVQVETDMVKRLGRTNQPWLLISLAPDLAGDYTITRLSFEAFETEIKATLLVPFSNIGGFYRIAVAHNRLSADDSNSTNDTTPRSRAVELHTDGAGVAAICIYDLGNMVMRHDGPPGQELHAVSDEFIAGVLLGGLQFLGRHASERTHASGMARLRATLLPSANVPALQLAYTRSQFPSTTGNFLTTPPAPVETFAALEDFAHGGSALVSAAARLHHGIGHQFGIAELPQFTLDGRIVGPFWDRRSRPMIDDWAEANGVDVLQQPAAQ